MILFQYYAKFYDRILIFKIFTRDILNFNDLVKFLEQAVSDYNNRPHAKLYGFTPNEVLQGAIPDKYRFSASIKNAVATRIETNLNSVCNKCLTPNV